MSDRTELSDLLVRPGLLDLIVRGHDDVWLRWQDGRFVRGPAIADSNQDLVTDVSRLAGPVGRRDGNRPHPKEEW